MEGWWLLGAKFSFHILVEIASNSLPTLCWRQMPNCPGGEKGRVAGRWLLGANLMSRPFLIWNRTTLCTASRALAITLKWQLCTVGNTLVSWTALCWQAVLLYIVFLFWGQSTQILVKTVQQRPYHTILSLDTIADWVGGLSMSHSCQPTEKKKQRNQRKRRWTLQAQKIQYCNMILAASHARLWLTLQPVKGGRGGVGSDGHVCNCPSGSTCPDWGDQTEMGALGPSHFCALRWSGQGPNCAQAIWWSIDSESHQNLYPSRYWWLWWWRLDIK